MFALTSSMSYFLCSRSIDMRKGIYSLYQYIKSEMGAIRYRVRYIFLWEGIVIR
jgi:hypothetical protein